MCQLAGQTCPIYGCNNTAPAPCYASTDNAPNQNNGTVHIYLDQNNCTWATQTCQFNYQSVFTQASYQGQCVNKTTPSTTGARYPGEACNVPADCKATTQGVGNCAMGKCAGQNTTQTCVVTSDCIVGNYCFNNGTNKTCQPLLAIGASGCTGTPDCVYNAFCSMNATSQAQKNGNCTAYNSFPDNTIVYLATGTTYMEHPSAACQNGDASTSNNCTSIDYAGATLAAKNSDNMVPCNTTQSCLYSFGQSLACECGYNAAGQGYCPVPSAYRSRAALSKAVQAMNSPLCHTLNRGTSCNLPTNYNSTLASVNSELRNTLYASRWYQAVPCANTVLSGSMATISYVALFALISLVL